MVEEALIAYPGVVVVVSHDRYFLNRVCTDILAFEGEGQVTHSVGNYDYYLEKRRRDAAAAARAAAPPAIATPAPAAPTSKKRKLSFKEQQELGGIEARIHAAEAEVTRIEALLADPDFHRSQGARVGTVMSEMDAARDTATRLFQRWEELERIRVEAGGVS